jgi:hypothetical protein
LQGLGLERRPLVQMKPTMPPGRTKRSHVIAAHERVPALRR